MAQYFFHLHERSGVLPDAEGETLESVTSARNRAVAAARSVISADVIGGVLDLSGFIEVTDEQGRIVLILHFEEAVLRSV